MSAPILRRMQRAMKGTKLVNGNCVCVCLRALISERQINERNNDLCVNSCVGHFTVILNSALQYSTVCIYFVNPFPSAPRLIFSLLFSRLSCYAARQQLKLLTHSNPPKSQTHRNNTQRDLHAKLSRAPPPRSALFGRNFVALLVVFVVVGPRKMRALVKCAFLRANKPPARARTAAANLRMRCAVYRFGARGTSARARSMRHENIDEHHQTSVPVEPAADPTMNTYCAVYAVIMDMVRHSTSDDGA